MVGAETGIVMQEIGQICTGIQRHIAFQLDLHEVHAAQLLEYFAGTAEHIQPLYKGRHNCQRAEACDEVSLDLITQRDAVGIVWDFHAQDGECRVQEDTLPTLTARYGTGGNNIPYVGVRRLTPVECSRLQGFPDDWNEELSDHKRYKQFGNAVCVPVAEWIGKRIIEYDKP